MPLEPVMGGRRRRPRGRDPTRRWHHPARDYPPTPPPERRLRQETAPAARRSRSAQQPHGAYSHRPAHLPDRRSQATPTAFTPAKSEEEQEQAALIAFASTHRR